MGIPGKSSLREGAVFFLWTSKSWGFCHDGLVGTSGRPRLLAGYEFLGYRWIP